MFMFAVSLRRFCSQILRLCPMFFTLVSTFPPPFCTAFLWQVWLIWYYAANATSLFGNNYSIISNISSQCQFAWWLRPSNRLNVMPQNTLQDGLWQDSWLKFQMLGVLFSFLSLSRFHLALNEPSTPVSRHALSLSGMYCAELRLQSSYMFILCSTELWSDRSISIESWQGMFISHHWSCYWVYMSVLCASWLKHTRRSILRFGALKMLQTWNTRDLTPQWNAPCRMHQPKLFSILKTIIEDERQNLCHVCHQPVAMSTGLYILWQDWGPIVMFSWDLVLDVLFSVSMRVTGSFMLAAVCP